MKFFVKEFSSSFLRVWSHLLKKSLIENFSFCAVISLNFYAQLCRKIVILTLVKTQGLDALHFIIRMIM